MSENKRLLSFLQSEKMNDYFFMDARTTKRGRIVFDLTGNDPQDLYVQTYGLERCLPDKDPVGEMKALFSFHYVISGAGYYEYEEQKIRIEAGSVFVVCADVVSTYYPDPKDPWTYVYFSLGGLLQRSIPDSLGLDPVNCVIDVKDNSEIGQKFMRVYESAMNTGEKSLQTVAALYDALAFLEQLNVKKTPRSNKERYVMQAINFIRNNDLRITVEAIAENCAVTSGYLTRVCKEVLGISLKEIITVYRMQLARTKLVYSKVSIGKIAEGLGYADKKHFVRVFKSIFGVTPTEYRERESNY